MILQVFFYLYATEPSDMMKKTLISVILLLAIAFSTYAQQHCFFTHYSTEDGLSQNTVMNILQDHKDNLWFATWDGINVSTVILQNIQGSSGKLHQSDQ